MRNTKQKLPQQNASRRRNYNDQTLAYKQERSDSNTVHRIWSPSPLPGEHSCTLANVVSHVAKFRTPVDAGRFAGARTNVDGTSRIGRNESRVWFRSTQAIDGLKRPDKLLGFLGDLAVEGFNKWAKEVVVGVLVSDRERQQLYLSPYSRQRLYFDFHSDRHNRSLCVDVVRESAGLSPLLALLPSVAIDSDRAEYSNRR